MKGTSRSVRRRTWGTPILPAAHAASAAGGRTADAAHHRTAAELEAGFDRVLASPGDGGTLEMIVRRPAVNQREAVEEGRLTLEAGLEGDTWNVRRGYVTEDGSPDPDAQITLTNSRFAALIAGSRDLWPLAGDQLYVDLDLSVDNLPPGARFRIGDAAIEIAALPHTGCKKYAQRFGAQALKFTATPEGRQRNLRGIYARVVEPGTVRVGDTIHRIG